MYSDIGRQSAEPVGWVKSECHLSFDALPYSLEVCSCVDEGTVSCGSSEAPIEGWGWRNEERAVRRQASFLLVLCILLLSYPVQNIPFFIGYLTDTPVLAYSPAAFPIYSFLFSN